MRAYNISTYQVAILRSMLSGKIITVLEGHDIECRLVDSDSLVKDNRINSRSVRRLAADRLIERDMQAEKRLSYNKFAYKITAIGVRAVQRNGLDIYR